MRSALTALTAALTVIVPAAGAAIFSSRRSTRRFPACPASAPGETYLYSTPSIQRPTAAS